MKIYGYSFLCFSFALSMQEYLGSLAGCREMFLFTVFCKIGALERNAY